MAWIAIGKSLALSHYQPLRNQVSQENRDSDCLAVPVSADVQTLQPENSAGPEIPDEVMSEHSGDDSQDTFIASAAEMLRKSCDQYLAKGIVKFLQEGYDINHSSGNALRFDSSPF